jgi:hypothetical protein
VLACPPQIKMGWGEPASSTNSSSQAPQVASGEMPNGTGSCRLHARGVPAPSHFHTE